MSIVILGDLFSIPEGSAATNRVYTYAKGFEAAGVRTHVVGFLNTYMEQPDGVNDGISYYNPFGQKERSRSFFMRRYHKLLKYHRTFKLLKRIHRQDPIIAINRWSDFFTTQLFTWLMARYFGAKLITECNEHPLRFYQQGYFRKKEGLLRFYADAFLSDGILCISRYLVDFHLKHSIKAKKLFHVPSTVDAARFQEKQSRPIKEFYIGYFGSLTFSRDNIGVLLNAFALLAAKQESSVLVLGGFCSPEEQAKIKDLISTNGISKRVILLEFLSRTEIARYVQNADILVMVRAKDLGSDASYPSKLTEFLATGQPVVSADVGEVSDFIKDGENAYLFPPNDHEVLARKLEYIFLHYPEAVQVGLQGRKLTHEVFSYQFQSGRILEYIKTL